MSNSEETNIVRRIMLKLGIIPGVRIFRNNIGKAWIGQSKKFTARQTVIVEAGDVLIRQGRFFDAGLCVGSSDLIGFKSILVTPEMVGKPVALFLAAEVKTEKGKASAEQIAFIEMVNKYGGVGFVARSAEEAEKFINP